MDTDAEREHNEPSRMSWMAPILFDLGIRRIEAFLAGSSDSGQLEEVRYYDEHGEQMDTTTIDNALTELKSPHSHGDLLSAIDNILVSDADREGNWYDNEGGTVDSAYEVREDGVFTEYVNLIYNEPDYDDEYDEEDEEEDYEP